MVHGIVATLFIAMMLAPFISARSGWRPSSRRCGTARWTRNQAKEHRSRCLEEVEAEQWAVPGSAIVGARRLVPLSAILHNEV